MIHFLAGAVTLAYVIAGVHFLRFWRKTFDRLFLSFAAAFGLLAIDQIATSALGVADERGNYVYILRVLGFLLILLAIVDKNILGVRRSKTDDTAPPI